MKSAEWRLSTLRGGRFAPDNSGRVDNRVGNARENRSKSECERRRAPPCDYWRALQRLPGPVSITSVRWTCGRGVVPGTRVAAEADFKSNTMSSATAVIPRLHHLKPVNLVALNPQDGQRYGFSTRRYRAYHHPGGQAQAQISLLHGVMPGVTAIEHGYGHKEMGAAQHTLDGEPMAFDEQIKSGINLNELVLRTQPDR